jgi:hypothetical protein
MSSAAAGLRGLPVPDNRQSAIVADVRGGGQRGNCSRLLPESATGYDGLAEIRNRVCPALAGCCQ